MIYIRLQALRTFLRGQHCLQNLLILRRTFLAPLLHFLQHGTQQQGFLTPPSSSSSSFSSSESSSDASPFFQVQNFLDFDLIIKGQ